MTPTPVAMFATIANTIHIYCAAGCARIQIWRKPRRCVRHTTVCFKTVTKSTILSINTATFCAQFICCRIDIAVSAPSVPAPAADVSTTCMSFSAASVPEGVGMAGCSDCEGTGGGAAGVDWGAAEGALDGGDDVVGDGVAAFCVVPVAGVAGGEGVGVGAAGGGAAGDGDAPPAVAPYIATTNVVSWPKSVPLTAATPVSTKLVFKMLARWPLLPIQPFTTPAEVLKSFAKFSPAATY